jgi:hypothetical protein
MGGTGNHLMLSEISQTEKDKYHLFFLMQNIDLKRKKVTVVKNKDYLG